MTHPAANTELALADAEITELIRRLGAARLAVREIEVALDQAWKRRNAIAAPAASGGFVRNALFILGGLLLAVAAIVFTAVAWAQFGIGGRAVLLAGFTGVALAVPPAAARRGLTATAETFAAVGFLLTLLDGYAAWHVNLLGVADGSGWGYSAAVFAVTGAVAAGYEHFTGLVAPRYAALLVAQPVVPLLVAVAEPGLTGWAFAFVGVAALDVAVLATGRLRLAATVAGGVAVVAAGVCALIGLASDEPFGAAAALVAAALAVVTGAVVARRRTARAIATSLLLVAFVVAAGRVTAVLSPAGWLVDVAAVVVVAALFASLIGARIAALSVAAVLGIAVFVVTVDQVTMARADWSVPVALALLVAAAIVLVPAGRRGPGAVLGAYAVLVDAVVLALAHAGVSVLEAYTLPTASVALLAGILVRRARPAAGSWTTYGLALVVALAPSLIAIVAGDGQHPRRLLLGLGALAIVLAGARAGLRAPVLLGGGALALVALHEMAPVWDLLPRWIPLAAAGLLLVALATTLERRRRDLDRLRATLHRFS
ncbi:SCO7613 C-terminal domain-containing membrane protein [Actinoplanes sp. NPDC048988]|uniref:SCO7613 C-terminal domain-containing membrane protein n=1 Tax=Actinoplanes sp. NPDC048988 TaxID=3363901 RepID=UPI00371FF6B8